MTIKDLCRKYAGREDCPFKYICDASDDIWFGMMRNEMFNINVSKSIVETARILEEIEEC